MVQRGQTVHRQHRFAFGGRLIVEMLFLIADHLFNDPRNTGIADGPFADKTAIAENGNVVANFHQFFQTMGDIDDGDAAPFKLPDNIEQDFDFRLAEGGGGLIHNQYARIFGQGARNFDQLLVANTQFPERSVGINIKLQSFQQ